MAWRPHENLVEGELDNTVPGKVTGWLRFVGLKEVVRLDLVGDFHRDIRGAKVRLSGCVLDNEANRCYMGGFSPVQTGEVGDITDRTIREYITTQSRALRKRALHSIYYLVVSSTFADDYDDAVRTLKMETGISEVCLVEADALVAMVAARMRDPLHVSLGPDGLQRLFCSSGVLSPETVRDTLG